MPKIRKISKEELNKLANYDFEWREIPGFPEYEINIRGDVYSKKRDRILFPTPGTNGIPRISLFKNGQIYHRGVHKLISQSFPPEHGKEWSDIDGFSDYEVSKNGEVYSRLSGKVMTPKSNGKGYLSVELCKNGKKFTKGIHRLVAKAFIPNPENKPEVNHRDGDKSNNQLSNLEWNTSAENIAHACSNGLRVSRKVRIIETGEVFNTVAECARYLDISRSHIYECMDGKIKSYKNFHFEEVFD